MRRAGLPALVLAAVLPALLAAMPRFPPLSGDEPHYVLMARSLVRDLDFEMGADDHADVGAWISSVPLESHTKPGARAGAEYSVHGYGLAAWIAPVVALDPLPPAGLRLFGCVVLLALGLALAREAERIAPHLPSLVIAGLALITAPLLFNAPHMFPDMLAATLALWAWSLLAPASGRGALAAGAVAMAMLPWLHYKFLPLWLLLAARAAARLQRREAVAVLALAALGPVSLSAFHEYAFGSVSPMAAAPVPVAALAAGTPLLYYLRDLAGALRTAVGLLVDQKDGLLMYAPHYLLAATGAAWLWKRNRAELAWLCAFTAAVWAPAALSQNTGLWGPPARWILGGIGPLALLAGIGICAPTASPWLRRARAVLVGTSAALALLYAASPELLYVDRVNTRSPLLQQIGGPGLELWRAWPLWTRIGDAPQWSVTIAWTLAVAAIAACLWRRGGAIAMDEAGAPLAGRWFAGTVALAVAAVASFSALAPVSGPEVTITREYGALRVDVARVPRTRAWPQPNSLWFGGDGTAVVWLSATRPLEALSVEVGAPSAVQVELAAGTAVEPLSLSLEADQTRRLRLQLRNQRRWAGRWYVPLRLTVRGGMRATEAFGNEGDERLLGAYVRFLTPPG